MKEGKMFQSFKQAIGITLTPSLRVYAKPLPVITAKKLGSGYVFLFFLFCP